MSSVICSPRPQRSVLRTLLFVVLIGAGSMALSLWWFDQPTAAGTVAAIEAPAPNARFVAVPAPIPSESVPNLEVIQSGTTDQGLERAIAYVHAPNTPALTTLLDEFLAEESTAFDRMQSATPRVELNIGWQVTAAAGEHLGVRLIRTLSTDHATPESVSATFYAQLNLLSASASTDLLSQSGQEQARQMIAAAPATEQVEEVEQPLPAQEQDLFRDIVFDASGTMLIVLPTHVHADHTGAQIAVEIPAIQVPELLTPLGLDIRRTQIEAVTFVGLTDTNPTPAATDSDSVADADNTSEASGAEKKSGQKPEKKKPTKAKKKSKKKPAAAKPVNCKKKKCIALTFDDGPGPHTDNLLKKLRKAKAPATFFVVGRNVGVYPETVRAMAKQGHEVASHTWSHQDLRRLSAKKIDKELSATNKAIKKATGNAPKLVRPPYGAYDADVRKVLKDRGESAIMWDVNTLDWQHKNSKRTAKAAIGPATRGSIVLMHDIQPSTVDAVPYIVKQLRKEGYTLVTVSELLGDVKPGKVYSRR